MRARILFVDDDPMVLRALGREMRAHADNWDCDFAGGGEDGMAQLAAKAYDILVTDMVMPGIDGAVLLHHARERYPSMVRIVLSAHAEFEHAVRSVPFAHQRLCKPWDRGELIATLTRAVALRKAVGDELILRCVSQLATLPSAAVAYAALGAALDSPNASFSKIASVVGSDIAMSAKLLQLANSAFVSPGRSVTDIGDAVRLVGLSAIRQYLLSPYLNVFELVSGDTRGFQALGEHARLVARLASELVTEPALRSTAFVTGMLHEIGRLVLVTRLPREMAALAAEATALDCREEALELRAFGVTHAEVGGFLLGLWGLPSEICDAVRGHHDMHAPSDGPLARALRLADWVATEHEARRRHGVTDPTLYLVERDEALVAASEIPRLLSLAARFASDSAAEHLLTAAS